MNLKTILIIFIAVMYQSLSAQTQSWQWVKAGGSSSDNGSPQPAECKIGGCDAKGNVYAVGMVDGPNMAFDTFSSAGSYSGTNTGGSYLLFSYDCTGNMRWAKQIGDEEGNFLNFGVVTDLEGNTYLAAQFYYGHNGGLVRLFLGDTTIVSTAPVLTLPYLCMVKYDSLGRLVWFKNFEEDTVHAAHVGSYQNSPYGLRIGSSGYIWMGCSLDSNYAISPNLHTTKLGRYNVEVDPTSGSILSGYYIAQDNIFGDAYSVDTYYDLDENENYYETGTLHSYGTYADTLILANQRIAPDINTSVTKPYIFSLDKQGNFRYMFSNKAPVVSGSFSSCKYDFVSDRLITCWGLDTMAVYGTDTFRYNMHQLNNSVISRGLLSIDQNGNLLWGKYLTKSDGNNGFIFWHIPTASYADNLQNNGLLIYNNTDTLFNKDSAASIYDYTKIISQIDQNGNITATHTAHLGNVGSLRGNNMVKYGATDWRGNVYLGGTVTNFFVTPADSVVNTDSQSGNFFIAKLGISDCSCPTPGVQYTQTVHGDTVFFYGISVNHNDSIRWRLGDGGISSSDTFFHVYTNHDSTYTVTAIAYSGCGIDSITKQITVRSVGIVPIEPDKTNLYPNLVKNTVNLEVTGPAMIGLVYANGSSVWNSPVQVNQQGTYVFDMSKFSCAMYYFIVQYSNGKTDVMQVVKE